METKVTAYDSRYMGNQLRKLRKAHKLTQEELAEKLNVSKDTIFNYEKGKTAIPHDRINQLCLEFGVSADYFFFGESWGLNEHSLSLKQNKNIDQLIDIKIKMCDEFQKRQILDLIDIINRVRPAI